MSIDLSLVLVVRNRDRQRNRERRARRRTVSKIDAFSILVLELEDDSFSSLFESTLEWLPLASKLFLLLCWTHGRPSMELITVAREMAQSSLLFPSVHSSHYTSHITLTLIITLSLSTHLCYKVWLQPPIGKSHQSLLYAMHITYLTFFFFFFFEKDITWGAFGYTLSNVKFLCISKMGGIWRWVLRIQAQLEFCKNKVVGFGRSD